jgi:hypothetical protein
MEMRTMKGIRLQGMLILALSILASPSYALNFSAVGGLNMSAPTISENGVSLSLSSKSTVGGGALLGFPVAKVMEIEFGGLYLPRRYGLSLGALGSSESTVNSIQVPLLLRFTAAPFISFGAGGYFANMFGNVKTTTTALGETATSEESLADSNMKSSDYGVALNARLHFAMAPGVSMIVDGRYNIGLANVYTESGGTIKFSDFQVLGGLTLGL